MSGLCPRGEKSEQATSVPSKIVAAKHLFKRRYGGTAVEEGRGRSGWIRLEGPSVGEGGTLRSCKTPTLAPHRCLLHPHLGHLPCPGKPLGVSVLPSPAASAIRTVSWNKCPPCGRWRKTDIGSCTCRTWGHFLALTCSFQTLHGAETAAAPLSERPCGVRGPSVMPAQWGCHGLYSPLGPPTCT